MIKKLIYGGFFTGLALMAQASVDSDFKPNAMQRFTLYTGDGNYKQAYRWAFNPQGSGLPVTVFINHGSGGEWYDEIDQQFGPCGPDHVNDDGDFNGTPYQGLCEVNSDGERLYLADFNDHHVPVGSKLEHVLYPGCRLDGYMEQDSNLPPGVVDADGRNAIGYQVALPSLFSFADEDKLYTSKCDDRIAQASQVSTDTPLVGKNRLIDGLVFSPAKHGFDYKVVYKNLDSFSSSDQAQAAQARSAIERAVNQLYLEMGLSGDYQLPADLD